jgi:hypothetical protein
MHPRTLIGHAAALLLLCLAGCGSTGSSFDWDVTPDRTTVAPGGKATYNLTVKSKMNINSEVSLRVTGAPPNATVSVNPTKISGTGTTATLSVQTAGSTPEGTYTISVFATETGQSEVSKDVLLIVSSNSTTADFSLEVDPAAFTFTDAESGKTFTYFVRPLNSFAGTVSVSVSGVPSFAVLSQAPTPASVTIGGATGGAGGTMVLRMTTGAFGQGPFDLTVTATSGGITHQRTIRITPPI